MGKKLLPYIYKDRFYNNADEINSGWAIRFFKMVLGSIKNKNFIKPEVFEWLHNPILASTENDPVIFWIGHSTFFIQLAGINIITDPIFGDASFLFRRIFPPGIDLQKLPKIDYVLISHNHPDHLHKESVVAISKLNNKVEFLVPRGDKKLLDSWGIGRIKEFDWWENYNKFTFLPSHHWSQRTLFDKNRSLWGSWLINIDNFKIYFAGDSAYNDHFKLIGSEYNQIDLALLPIAPCEPRAFMSQSHMGSVEAGQAFLDLKAKNFIPMHWGTFFFGTDKFYTPIEYLNSWWEDNKLILSEKRLFLPKFGEKLRF